MDSSGQRGGGRVQIEIVSERETATGWRFRAQVLDEAGALSGHDVGLSWADYNLWSRSGADVPAAVAEAVIRFLLSRRELTSLKPTFDASLARRLDPTADTGIPSLIHDL